MLTIRLSRTGKKSQPSFRIVLQEHTAAVQGKFIEILGYYKPSEDPKVLEVNEERIKHWISVGAKPSDTLAVLLKGKGFEGMDKYIAPRNKKRNKKGEEAAPAAVPVAAPAEGNKKAPVEAPAEALAAPAEEPVKAEKTKEKSE
ncbi:MAG: 30S ribosomal protein S16 [Patescibacteria group bacterium]